MEGKSDSAESFLELLKNEVESESDQESIEDEEFPEETESMLDDVEGEDDAMDFEEKFDPVSTEDHGHEDFASPKASPESRDRSPLLIPRPRQPHSPHSSPRHENDQNESEKIEESTDDSHEDRKRKIQINDLSHDEKKDEKRKRKRRERNKRYRENKKNKLAVNEEKREAENHKNREKTRRYREKQRKSGIAEATVSITCGSSSDPSQKLRSILDTDYGEFVSIKASPDSRDRSPLRSQTQSTCYSPFSSPSENGENERTVAFWENEDVVAAHDLQDAQQIDPERTVRNHRRGGPRTRGTRLRGGIRGRGGRQTATAVGIDSVWRRGDRILEICLNDEDVPPELRDMVNDLEASRLLRSAKRAKRRDNAKVKNDDDDDDEYYDAQSVIANELFAGDSTALNFQWSPMATFSGKREEFVLKQTGPTTDSSSAYEAFRMYWDDKILEHIVTETNRYAIHLKTESERFARDWYDTNVDEILVLFTFWIMLGIIRMPSIKSCFSSGPILNVPVYRTLMNEKRYWMLNRALHFNNNDMRKPDSPKLFGLGPIPEHLDQRFKEAYIPQQDITIEDSLILWRGKLPYRQYMKSKAARFGIKTFELCEAATGYMWSFIIYSGKDLDASRCRLPSSVNAVVKLVGPLLNKGYRLFLDNLFNSPILARFLKRNKTDCVGTLRKNTLHVPALIQLASVPEGRLVARHSGDVAVMAYNDKNPVYTISTCHGIESTYFESKFAKPSHHKPAVIADYNKYMEIDREDQMLEPYLIEKNESRKWYKKIFKRLLNVSIFNSSILHRKSQDNMVEQQAFRLELVKEILEKHLKHVPRAPQKHTSHHRNFDLPEHRFVGAHYIVRASVSDDEHHRTRLTTTHHRNSKNRRTCVWCKTRKFRYSRTVYVCEQCDVPLCLDECFKKFHTVP